MRVGAAAVLTGLMMLFNDQVLPEWNHQARTLTASLKRRKAALVLKEKEGLFIDDLGAYNLLLSREWMAIVRRRREGIRGFSVNALGFAGSLLSTEASDRQWIQRSGPEALLQAVVDADG